MLEDALSHTCSLGAHHDRQGPVQAGFPQRLGRLGVGRDPVQRGADLPQPGGHPVQAQAGDWGVPGVAQRLGDGLGVRGGQSSSA